MELLIKIDEKLIEIILFRKHEKIDKLAFLDKHNLTENLLKLIDTLLKKNNLKITEIKKARLETSSKQSLTSIRIIQTVVNTINWVNQKKGKAS